MTYPELEETADDLQEEGNGSSSSKSSPSATDAAATLVSLSTLHDNHGQPKSHSRHRRRGRCTIDGVKTPDRRSLGNNRGQTSHLQKVIQATTDPAEKARLEAQQSKQRELWRIATKESRQRKKEAIALAASSAPVAAAVVGKDKSEVS
jgi:hypothetical protein